MFLLKWLTEDVAVIRIPRVIAIFLFALPLIAYMDIITFYNTHHGYFYYFVVSFIEVVFILLGYTLGIMSRKIRDVGASKKLKINSNKYLKQ